MIIKNTVAIALAAGLSMMSFWEAKAHTDPARYVAAAPQLMMQVCSAFFSGAPMAPVLRDLEAWPAHEPLRRRLLGDREGKVFLTRQFGYGLYALTFEASGQCGVEVFAVPTGLARSRFAGIGQTASASFISAPLMHRDETAPQSIPLVRNPDGAGLDLHLRITEDTSGRGSAAFILTRKRATTYSL